MTATLSVRVTLLDTLDELDMDVAGSTPVTEIKRRSLAQSGIRRSPEDYVVKYKGAELYEGARTLAEAGVVEGGALIVLRRRRTPVR